MSIILEEEKKKPHKEPGDWTSVYYIPTIALPQSHFFIFLFLFVKLLDREKEEEDEALISGSLRFGICPSSWPFQTLKGATIISPARPTSLRHLIVFHGLVCWWLHSQVYQKEAGGIAYILLARLSDIEGRRGIFSSSPLMYNLTWHTQIGRPQRLLQFPYTVSLSLSLLPYIL